MTSKASPTGAASGYTRIAIRSTADLAVDDLESAFSADGIAQERLRTGLDACPLHRSNSSATSHAQDHQLGAARPSRSGDHAAVHGLAGIASMDLPGTAAGSSEWGRESDEGNAGTQSIGSAVIDVTSGDYFALTARQSSVWTKNVAADQLTWFAFEVVD